MPRIFDIKAKKDVTPGGTSNPCGICQRQFAKYTCPSCNLQYCSLVCYRSEAHSQCTEVFYKTAITEQIRGEPARSNQEKMQMLELLKRFEDEAVDDNDGDEVDDILSRLEGIDLDNADHEVIWEALTESEKQKFLKMISNPNSGESQQMLNVGNFTEMPWWSSEFAPEKAPPIRPIPENLLKISQFNPMLLFNTFHLSLSYAYTIRTFGVSMFSSTNQAQDEIETYRDLLFQLSPFIADRKSTLLFTSVDGVVTDWISHLPELPTPELVQLLITDVQTLFRSHPVVDTEENSHSQCMRFLSNILSLVDSSKKHAHISHKLTFYLAFVSKLPTQASKDLIDAIGLWVIKTQRNTEGVIEPPVNWSKPLVEEL